MSCIMARSKSVRLAKSLWFSAAVAMPRSAAHAKPAASGLLDNTAAMRALAMFAFTIACILLPRPEIRITMFFMVGFPKGVRVGMC